MATPTTFEHQIPELMRHFELTLRSGYNIRQSFAILAQDLPVAAAGLDGGIVALAARPPRPDLLPGQALNGGGHGCSPRGV